VPIAADVADAAPHIEIAEAHGDPTSLAMQLAQATAIDGEQSAIGGAAAHLGGGRRRANPARVQPWLWNAQTSGGKARTIAGAETGYELRLSRSASKS
jgi:hypothetical protein